MKKKVTYGLKNIIIIKKCYCLLMANLDFSVFDTGNFQQEKGRPLPKFGEWDVNNPASADGFTVIFAKARDDKKASSNTAPTQTPRSDYNYGQPNPYQQEARVYLSP